MGSAAAYQLARRGASVVGIDRFAPPHAQGSSHGHTRITRQAIGEGESYVPMVLRSNEIWREIEAATGETLFLPCGALIMAEAGSHHPQKAGFVDATIAAARRFAIAHEVLDAAEIAARYPQFILRGDERGYHEPGGGLLYPERCIAAQLRLAAGAGAAIRTGEVVTAVEATGSGVRIVTDRDTYEAGRAIVSAGAWNPGLVGPALGHMRLHRQMLGWFDVDEPADYAPDRFPVFMRMHGQAGDQCYGFPIPAGTEGFKVATEAYPDALPSPEAMDREVAPAEIDDVYDRHVAGRFRGVRRRTLEATTCLYTLAADNRFVIAAHPESRHVIVVSACSGHGFKHSAAIGEAAAELALTGAAALDLAAFGFA